MGMGVNRSAVSLVFQFHIKALSALARLDCFSAARILIPRRREIILDPEESVGLRVNLLHIRLDGPYFGAFLGNRTTITLQNRQNLSSTSRIFASIS
ncbi:MAG: hypothetical protein EG822_05800 [Deltaproteobacteria bacterium]|nr:hypothetical protein [Deltaproteobacteria bacterium]TLN00568.1 MAG: hypothetical protein FDZ73_19015 [bacterium]